MLPPFSLLLQDIPSHFASCAYARKIPEKTRLTSVNSADWVLKKRRDAASDGKHYDSIQHKIKFLWKNFI